MCYDSIYTIPKKQYNGEIMKRCIYLVLFLMILPVYACGTRNNYATDNEIIISSSVDYNENTEVESTTKAEVENETKDNNQTGIGEEVKTEKKADPKDDVNAEAKESKKESVDDELNTDNTESITNDTENEPNSDAKDLSLTDVEIGDIDSVNTSGDNNGRLVVIDAGHQQKGDSSKEPIGPGAVETKAKVTGGTSGKTSGLSEYQLTLMVASKLGKELELRGYRVLMTRTSHDVNISNSQRAAIANENNADVFIRIHANGSDNTSVNGAMTICQTATNPYNASWYMQSKKLSTCVLDKLVEATGCRREKIWETDTMSGINWCQVPVTIVEMGYMTNPDEDLKMASDEYQNKIVTGIANGIDNYFE